MKANANKYSQALFEILTEGDTKNSKEMIKNFLSILRSNNHEYLLDRILLDFEKKWDNKFSIVKTELASARPMNDKTKKIISSYVKKVSGAKELIINENIDKKILGGVVIRYKDRIFDASLRNRLNKMKENLLNS